MSRQRIREDLHVVSRHIPAGSRVLDLGCGDAELLEWLIARRQCCCTGVERDADAVLAGIARGVPIIDLDIDTQLDIFAPDSFDVVVLSRTLQALTRPDLVLAQLSRLAPKVIVSMPNFAYWRHRLRLLSGHMPQSKDLPFSWYESPNSKFATLADLEPLFGKVGLEIVQRIPLLASGRPGPTQVGANLLASSAIYVLQRQTRPVPGETARSG